ncbi:hypothetical protein ABG768_015421, partial [Culter alburnus]
TQDKCVSSTRQRGSSSRVLGMQPSSQTSVKGSEAVDVWASLRVDHAFTLHSINRR